jgi:hypothetical protein
VAAVVAATLPVVGGGLAESLVDGRREASGEWRVAGAPEGRPDPGPGLRVFRRWEIGGEPRGAARFPLAASIAPRYPLALGTTRHSQRLRPWLPRLFASGLPGKCRHANSPATFQGFPSYLSLAVREHRVAGMRRAIVGDDRRGAIARTSPPPRTPANLFSGNASAGRLVGTADRHGGEDGSVELGVDRRASRLHLGFAESRPIIAAAKSLCRSSRNDRV